MGGDGGAGSGKARETLTEGGAEGESGRSVKGRRTAKARDPMYNVVPDGAPRAIVAGIVIRGKDGGRVARGRRGRRGRGRSGRSESMTTGAEGKGHERSNINEGGRRGR